MLSAWCCEDTTTRPSVQSRSWLDAVLWSLRNFETHEAGPTMMAPAKAPGVRGSRGTLHASRALHFDPIKLTKSGRFAVVFQVSQRTGIHQTLAINGDKEDACIGWIGSVRLASLSRFNGLVRQARVLTLLVVHSTTSTARGSHVCAEPDAERFLPQYIYPTAHPILASHHPLLVDEYYHVR